MAKKQDSQEPTRFDDSIPADPDMDAEPMFTAEEAAAEVAEAIDAAIEAANLTWHAGVPTDPFLTAEAWQAEYDWQVEHNGAFQPHMMPPKPQE